MKKSISYSRILFMVTMLGAIFAINQTVAVAQEGKKGEGTLTIFRAADLGENLTVSIDGAKKADVRRGDTFNTTLPAGPHKISVILYPNNLNLAPTVMDLNVEAGKTYAFTAMWQGETLVLKH